jgi:hypothetical protein
MTMTWVHAQPLTFALRGVSIAAALGATLFVRGCPAWFGLSTFITLAVLTFVELLVSAPAAVSDVPVLYHSGNRPVRHVIVQGAILIFVRSFDSFRRVICDA